MSASVRCAVGIDDVSLVGASAETLITMGHAEFLAFVDEAMEAAALVERMADVRVRRSPELHGARRQEAP